MSDIPESLPNFDGKIVFAMFSRGGEDGQAISEARYQLIAGRVFLVGTIPVSMVPGFDNCEIAVAWDQVEQYVILDSIDQFHKRSKLLARAERRRKRGQKVSWLYGGD